MQRTLPGPKVLLVGGSGAGKTYSLRTLPKLGMKVFVVFTEPGMEVLADIPCSEGMHWKYIPAVTASWAELEDAANKVNKFSYKALAEMGDINKGKYREFIELISSMANLKCDRCEQTFGAADTLSNEWCVVLDSLSGLSQMAMSLVIGGKPTASMPDWGIAMKNIESFVNKFTMDIPCMAVMIAHLERESDEVTGAVVNMASTLGRKLAPKLPRYFSEVVHARRDGSTWLWSTTTNNTDLKTRVLPITDKIIPDYKPLVETWKARLKAEPVK